MIHINPKTYINRAWNEGFAEGKEQGRTEGALIHIFFWLLFGAVAGGLLVYLAVWNWPKLCPHHRTPTTIVAPPGD